LHFYIQDNTRKFVLNAVNAKRTVMIKDRKDKIKQFFKSLFTRQVNFTDYETFKEYKIERSLKLMEQINFDSIEKSIYSAGYIQGVNDTFKDIERQIL